MKKLLIALIACCLAAGLAACNTATVPGGDDPDSPPAPDPIYNPLTNLQVNRPIEARMLLVSIGNSSEARPQYGFSDADIIYEVPAEGNIPRLLALFYSDVPDVIGGVRSARPYMIDIAREWDALLVHCGGSQEALNFLASSSAVENLNEIAHGSYFWRDSSRVAPHNLMTSGENLYRYLKDSGRDTVQEDVRQLKFLAEGESPAGTAADWINLRYADANVEYTYDKSISCYTRVVNGQPFIDAATGASAKAANIIVQKVTSSVEDSDGHIAIDMCAGGEAYLFTGGTVQQGTWSRANLDSPTIFVDANGEEFKLNAGQTWIQIVDGNVGFSYINTTPETPAEGEDAAAESEQESE